MTDLVNVESCGFHKLYNTFEEGTVQSG